MVQIDHLQFLPQIDVSVESGQKGRTDKVSKSGNFSTLEIFPLLKNSLLWRKLLTYNLLHRFIPLQRGKKARLDKAEDKIPPNTVRVSRIFAKFVKFPLS